jgi:hypothetical protein
LEILLGLNFGAHLLKYKADGIFVPEAIKRRFQACTAVTNITGAPFLFENSD